jgi:hypothetical protein
MSGAVKRHPIGGAIGASKSQKAARLQAGRLIDMVWRF